MQRKITGSSVTKIQTVNKCPVYLRLSWLGTVSEKFAKKIKSTVQNCCFTSNVHFVFSALMFSTLMPSSRCSANYVGGTTLRLDGRVQQHLHTKIRNGTYQTKDVLANTYGPSITNHIIKIKKTVMCSEL